MRLRVRDPRLLLVVSAALLGAAVAFPLGVIATHQFTDVPTSSKFHADIDAIRDAGVTTGCGPGKYCPKDFVTREQMAAFLNRLGALQAGRTPVVNADKVDGKDEVLGAGNVVIRQNGALVNEGPPNLVVEYLLDTTTIKAAGPDGGGLLMTLQEPGIIDGQAYGFQSVQICWHNSTNSTIYSTRVAQSGAGFLVQDGTDYPMIFPDCITLIDETPTAAVGATRLHVQMEFSTAGTAALGDVVTTWVPIP